MNCVADRMLSDPNVCALECWDNGGSDSEHEAGGECALEVEGEEVFYTSC
jgi:hypothetical protein